MIFLGEGSATLFPVLQRPFRPSVPRRQGEGNENGGKGLPFTRTGMVSANICEDLPAVRFATWPRICLRAPQSNSGIVMNIHEYQAKELLAKFGIPIPAGHAAMSADEAVAAAKKLPGPLWVVKSQIHAGGRGKGKFKELG